MTAAMLEIKSRQKEAASDAVALRRKLRERAGKGITLPSGVRFHPSSKPKTSSSSSSPSPSPSSTSSSSSSSSTDLHQPSKFSRSTAFAKIHRRTTFSHLPQPSILKIFSKFESKNTRTIPSCQPSNSQRATVSTSSPLTSGKNGKTSGARDTSNSSFSSPSLPSTTSESVSAPCKFSRSLKPEIPCTEDLLRRVKFVLTHIRQKRRVSQSSSCSVCYILPSCYKVGILFEKLKGAIAISEMQPINLCLGSKKFALGVFMVRAL